MAALPSPSQVAGSHTGIYEAYYHQVDPDATGAVQAPEAARFLKKSKLSDVVLSKIWDLSDPAGKGYLDKEGVFVALKLVALAQAGRELTMSAVLGPAPPPSLGEVRATPPARPAAPPAAAPAAAPPGDWSMRPSDRDKYTQLFESLHPVAGLIPGNKVKGVLLESKLPLETLGRIWDLADQDRDGALDKHEFCVAMHLVYKALEKHAVPTTLPAELRRAATPAPPAASPLRPASPARPPPPHSLLDFSPPGVGAGVGLTVGSTVGLTAGSGGTPSAWVVSAEEQERFAELFVSADADRDGLVSGPEIKHLFLDTGLPQHTLAHIWALCDGEGRGALSRDQFALAMWLAGRAASGVSPPTVLAPEMVPPSSRSLPQHRQQDRAERQQDEWSSETALGPQPTAELEGLARAAEALGRERRALEREVAERGARAGEAAAECAALQAELDALAAALTQLDAQKGEAHRRLHDLHQQVEKARAQVSAQEAACAEAEGAVRARRGAADAVRAQDAAVRDELARTERAADELSRAAADKVLQLSQARLKVSHLEEQLRTLEGGVATLDAGGAAAAGALALQPLFGEDALSALVRGATPSDMLEREPAVNGFGADPFLEDPFAPSPAHHDHRQASFEADPFAHDPFAPTLPHAPAGSNGGAQWEEDPFAVLHAPARPPSAPPSAHAAPPAPPAPTLPPKRHKTPPPRPAPPKQHHKVLAPVDFAEDPFKDYRYEDPDNIEDPFAEPSPVRGGRASAPPDNNNDEGWAAWPPVTPPADPWSASPAHPALDDNSNETWHAHTLPGNKHKSPKPVKYAKSLVHTLGGLGRARRRSGGAGVAGGAGGAGGAGIASEEQQWAWAAAESRRVQAEAEARRRREEAELQLALALSRTDK